jgi:hypothetical protein
MNYPNTMRTANIRESEIDNGKKQILLGAREQTHKQEDIAIRVQRRTHNNCTETSIHDKSGICSKSEQEGCQGRTSRPKVAKKIQGTTDQESGPSPVHLVGLRSCQLPHT